MTQQAAIVSTCPLCAHELTFRFSTDEIPFFGEIMLVSASCGCGFKYADTISLCEREAERYEMEFDSDDFTTRVIRSSSGTVQIPELGVTVEPGSASEAYISNVEGVSAESKRLSKRPRSGRREILASSSWGIDCLNGSMPCAGAKEQ